MKREISRASKFALNSKRNIVFIGPMGVGKTTIARRVAKRLGADFYDSDHEIELRTGANVAWIFEIEGEAGFRQRESEIITWLCQLNNIVLATGGGVVLSQANCDKLKTNSIVFYLKSTPEKLLKRTQIGKHRPLLQTGDKYGRIKCILKERAPLYEAVADEIIDTDHLSVDHIVNKTLEALKKYEDD